MFVVLIHCSFWFLRVCIYVHKTPGMMNSCMHAHRSGGQSALLCICLFWSPLYFLGLSLDLGLTCLVLLPGCQTFEMLVSTSLPTYSWDYRYKSLKPQLLHGHWESELRSSCLYSKHFANWAIFLGPVLLEHAGLLLRSHSLCILSAEVTVMIPGITYEPFCLFLYNFTYLFNVYRCLSACVFACRRYWVPWNWT